MKKIFTLAFITLLFACKDNKPTPETGIVRKWKLISYCESSGTNTCTSVTVPDSKGVFIEFSSSGSFDETYQGTNPIDYAFLGCGDGDYSLENGYVRIRAICMASPMGRLIKIKSVSDKKLILIQFDTDEYIFERE